MAPVDARNRRSGLAIPPGTPLAPTLVGPPDELSCPNDNIGVADSGEVVTLSDTPNSIKHLQSNLRPRATEARIGTYIQL